MTKLTRLIGALAVSATLAVSGALILSGTAQAQRRSQSSTLRRQTTTPRSAYEQGYLSGYNDGYSSGKSDYNTRSNRDFQRSALYQEANRGYESRFGSINDFQEGYRIGYEIAYTDGYYGRTLNSAIPPNVLALRSATTSTSSVSTNANQPPTTYSGRPRPGGSISVPNGTEMRLRLSSSLSTKTNHQGDRFTATVLSPNAYESATVEGHIAKIDRSGKLTGRTEMALDFDTITTRDGRTGPLHGQIEKIYASESVKSVDEEGNIETASKSKDTQIRTAGGAVLGAIIGGIAGGGKGAAIGAILGAGAGAGSVYVQGNKDLILDPGTEMTIRTSAPQRERARQ